MNDRPTKTALLRAVERFLEEDVVPSLSGPRRYHARVAANVVAIVAREIETEEEHLRAEDARLAVLLDEEPASPMSLAALRVHVASVNEALSRRIRAGDADGGAWGAAVHDHLRKTVADKLEVARPPRYRRGTTGEGTLV